MQKRELSERGWGVPAIIIIYHGAPETTTVLVLADEGASASALVVCRGSGVGSFTGVKLWGEGEPRFLPSSWPLHYETRSCSLGLGLSWRIAHHHHRASFPPRLSGAGTNQLLRGLPMLPDWGLSRIDGANVIGGQPRFCQSRPVSMV